MTTNSNGRISTTERISEPTQTSSDCPNAFRKRGSLHSWMYHLRVKPLGRMVADQLLEIE
ncbi:hypothetical protein D9M69_578820 [compost metagenome]